MTGLQRILLGTDVVKNVNKNNTSHAVLFEALALVMHLDAEKEMMSQYVCPRAQHSLFGKYAKNVTCSILGRKASRSIHPKLSHH